LGKLIHPPLKLKPSCVFHVKHARRALVTEHVEVTVISTGSATELEVNMKKILVHITFLFVLVVTNAFAQTDSTRVLEISDDFTEIMVAFQKRVHGNFPEYNYFYHDERPFDIENRVEGELFDKKAKKIIGINKYFIFELSAPSIYLLYLVNKEDLKAIAFVFLYDSNDWLAETTPCSQAEIDKALGLYTEW